MDTDTGSDQWNRHLQFDTDLTLALGTDDVGVTDLRSPPPTLVRAVFQEGTRIVGTDRDARQLRGLVFHTMPRFICSGRTSRQNVLCGTE